MTAELLGLVLAGGRSRRMAADKGSLELEGSTLALRARAVLLAHCRDVYVSVRADQAMLPSYARHPLVVDDASCAGGPAAGLLAAWAVEPDAALFVLAVDMANVDAALLGTLVRARNADAFATAFENAEGTLEPLCAIWEPRARRALLDAASESSSGVSPRRVLERVAVERVPAAQPAKLSSVNTPDEYAQLLGTRARHR
jgi:molybdopterin-guanine dinucleotide biosynthesis protein A